MIVALRWRPLQRVEAAAVVPVVTIALLRSLHVFRTLPAPALEGVARKAHTFSVAAGASIVRQGEPGDRYYAIADGTVEVVKDGSRVALTAAARVLAKSHCFTASLAPLRSSPSLLRL